MCPRGHVNPQNCAILCMCLFLRKGSIAFIRFSKRSVTPKGIKTSLCVLNTGEFSSLLFCLFVHLMQDLTPELQGRHQFSNDFNK